MSSVGAVRPKVTSGASARRSAPRRPAGGAKAAGGAVSGGHKGGKINVTA